MYDIAWPKHGHCACKPKALYKVLNGDLCLALVPVPRKTLIGGPLSRLLLLNFMLLR